MRCELSDICVYRNERIPTNALNSHTYVSTENMLPDKGGITDAASLPTVSQTSKFRYGDTLVSNIRPYFKKIWFAEYDGGCSNDVLVFSAKEGVDPKYLYYVLANDSFFAYSTATSKGTKMPRGDKTSIMQYQNEKVDSPTQKKIAAILSALDEKIAINRAINENLYAQAKAIFDGHFINIDAIPAGWRKGNLLDIANYLNGLAMQKFRPQGHEIGLPVLKIKELRQGSCDDSSERCSLSIKPEYIIHDGDVIFSWSGSLLVDVWCGGTCGLNQHLFKVTSDVYDKWFYYLWTAHHLARFIAIASDKATTMGHIKREELAKAEVLIPCEKDYTSLSSIMQPVFELIISNRIESRKLAALRDELLPKLMSGEIDVSTVQL